MFPTVETLRVKKIVAGEVADDNVARPMSDHEVLQDIQLLLRAEGRSAVILHFLSGEFFQPRGPRFFKR